MKDVLLIPVCLDDNQLSLFYIASLNARENLPAIQCITLNTGVPDKVKGVLFDKLLFSEAKIIPFNKQAGDDDSYSAWMIEVTRSSVNGAFPSEAYDVLGAIT